MCGIIGYVGPQDAGKVVISGLKRLEYRGYDSAGIALQNVQQPELLVVRTAGKVTELEIELDARQPLFSTGTAIGHTRWATHGEPTRENAHPHSSSSGNIVVAHNGIIDNYLVIKQLLQGQGIEFTSETDTEVIAHLIEHYYEGELSEAVGRALQQLEGTYGLMVMSALHPNMLVTARNGSPIVVGICDGETVIASDVSAVVSHTKQVIYLDDGDLLTTTSDGVSITSLRNLPVARDAIEIDWDIEAIEKGGFEHFMRKEIHEQPTALQNTLRGRLDFSSSSTKLSGMQMGPTKLADIDRIMVAACGTSLYAGMVGKHLFEDFTGIPTDILHAAEFRDHNPIVQRGTCMLAISQSGETADTLGAVRECLRKGAQVLGICNVVGSTIAREAGKGVYLHAGPEIGVASTKAFTSQVAVLAMMAILLGRSRRLSADSGQRMIDELSRLPELAQAVLDQEDEIAGIAAKYARAEHAFFLGRGYMYPAALEGALKLKELSYIHAEGYHAAELKHGPIALLTEQVPVIVIAPDSSGKSRTLANIQECKARKAPVIAIVTEGERDINGLVDDVISIPHCEEFIAAIPAVIAEQLFAYHIARERGCEIDQPRNLAKAVTVE
ncbi:MAG: glutamine--fructose-6-phosphate transaminase (isomerizing) [Halieaceae bacterium]|nr:glutamine--fructose-6-phosphate transaminase (isomerizing) [Halieaceae bacterium]